MLKSLNNYDAPCTSTTDSVTNKQVSVVIKRKYGVLIPRVIMNLAHMRHGVCSGLLIAFNPLGAIFELGASKCE